MPHIASQALYQKPGEVRSWELASKTSAVFHRQEPASPYRRQPLNAATPSLSLLVTNSQSGNWKIQGDDNHVRSFSHDTPVSGVDSIFELPSAINDPNTPSSSTHSLLFELEDTSPAPFVSSLPVHCHQETVWVGTTSVRSRPRVRSDWKASVTGNQSLDKAWICCRSPNSSTSKCGLHSKISANSIPGTSGSVHLLPELLQTPKAPYEFPASAVVGTKSHTYVDPRTLIGANDPLETPQASPRSTGSSMSIPDTQCTSPAALSSSELFFDPSQNPDLHIKSSRSRSHLHFQSEISNLHEDLPGLSFGATNFSSPESKALANIETRGEMVINSIAAIEESNRQLHARALAAEKKAKVLQELNLTLQSRVVYCEQQHRPKTAPTRTRRAASEGASMAPVSAFSTFPTRRRPPPLNLTPEMRSISHDYELAARGSPKRAAGRQHQIQSYSDDLNISGPIPGSVVQQKVTYRGTPVSNRPPVATISLAVAQRREKPLPYILPMSPSAVPGFVEMGNRTEVCAAEKQELKKRKTFGDLFRRGKPQA